MTDKDKREGAMPDENEVARVEYKSEYGHGLMVNGVEVEAYTRSIEAEHVAKKINRALVPILEEAREFKNFHRLLCERFGYHHDPNDWKRDQASLIEHISAKAKVADEIIGAARELIDGDGWATGKTLDRLKKALESYASAGGGKGVKIWGDVMNGTAITPIRSTQIQPMRLRPG